jgi:hypothetical protein
MNKTPPINPALARIQALKARSGSGLGRSFNEIPTAPFEEPIRPPEPVKVPTVEVTGLPLPPLEEDQDELRVAERLIALQAEGVGVVVPSRTERYNHLDGQMDRVIDVLKEIDPRNRIQMP